MVGDSSLQEGRGSCTCWFLACSLCLRAAGGTGTPRAARSMQALLRTPTTSVTSDPACSEPRPGCHHLLASGPYLTCRSSSQCCLAVTLARKRGLKQSGERRGMGRD